MDSIFKAIPKIFEQIEANPDAREAFVFAAWRRTVGDLLNEHTVPVELAGSKLRVAVANLTWQRHLEDMAAQILAKLNSWLGRSPVRFIEFYIDEKRAAANRLTSRVPDDSEPDRISEEISTELGSSAAAINDQELRDAFLLAAQSCLARKERMNRAI
ncbi:MAG: DciA family protein [Pyrinomonadaceae bacterium]